MHTGTAGRLMAILRGIRLPVEGSDAELLNRFIASRDAAAFETIVSRHGRSVFAVCRAGLGNCDDADDAFQAVFLVLARDAARIRDGNSLAGWLNRVAHLVCIDARRRAMSRKTEPLVNETESSVREPILDVADSEFHEMLWTELAALPEKFRTVLILCVMEGLSNTEASVRVGCPRGTIDTRLAAAKRKLRDRLVKRGITAASAATLEQVLEEASNAASRWRSLIETTVSNALRYSLGSGFELTPATLLANGVRPMMHYFSRTLAAMFCVALTVGGAGFGTYYAGAEESPRPAEPPAFAKPAPKPEAAGIEKREPTDKKKETVEKKRLTDENEIRKALDLPFIMKEPTLMSLEALFELIWERYGVVVRLDSEAAKRLPPFGEGGEQIADMDRDPMEKMIKIRRMHAGSLADLLTDSIVQLPGRWSYRIRNSQIMVTPAFRPTFHSDDPNQDDQASLAPGYVHEQVVGSPISVSFEDKSLTQVIRDLRKSTGANIVLDSRCKKQAQEPISATFDDVRLLHALDLLADMCELKAVWTHNVYYITTPENALKVQKQSREDIYGRAVPPRPQPLAGANNGMFPGQMGGIGVPGQMGGIGGLGLPGGGNIIVMPQPAPSTQPLPSPNTTPAPTPVPTPAPAPAQPEKK